MRHRPPFQDRSWVLNETSRAEHIGSDLDCPLCDRAELPADLVVARTAGPFDEATIPDGLRRAHRAPAGTWALLQVSDGSIDFSLDTVPPIERHLSAGESQPIPPEVPHQVSVNGPVRLQVDFLTRP
jgi:tellurite resistance-related uncharacterized protein